MRMLRRKCVWVSLVAGLLVVPHRGTRSLIYLTISSQLEVWGRGVSNTSTWSWIVLHHIAAWRSIRQTVIHERKIGLSKTNTGAHGWPFEGAISRSTSQV
ncbi:hypothetical protein B0J18DRAFT_439004 [Chaetomium sp. MPI-SDFR-AT-0129]|nr:hypothetical protein B0J18DRAFT_439004 [Chaetomium sp. MPI-SDFR-AT-0129]